MSQTPIPFWFLRGGTSRGPYFRRSDLPEDLDTLSEVLVAAVGSGHPLNIDGIGGGNAVTTKVAMLSRSEDDWADIDYFFAQVSVEGRTVDFKPTCGNILSGVGPAAIEMGMIEPAGGETEVRIRAVNTGARIAATVQTGPQGVVYEGAARVDAPPRECLRQLCTALMERMTQDELYFDFLRLTIGESGRFPQLAQVFLKNFTRVGIAAFTEILSTYPALKGRDVETITRVMTGSLIAHVLTQYVMHGRQVVPIEEERIIDAIVDLVLPPDPAS